YASSAPGSRLEAVVSAIEAAAARGVAVRFLAEKKFQSIYPQTLARLEARAGIEVRIFDGAALLGGVHHAKYFLVDRDQAFLGSQNFDWRALAHIQELGVRLRGRELARPLQAVFEADWNAAAAGPAPELTARTSSPPPGSQPIAIADPSSGDTLWVHSVISPQGHLAAGSDWDLPHLIERIDAARRTVQIQLLTYRTVGRQGDYFGNLESALRRASARGARVELLVSEWALRQGTVEGLQSLQALPRIEVRFLRIPPHSSGFIPYARVAHAKYMVVDRRAAWIGTSNWERDYFFASRNVGLILEGAGLPAALGDFFRANWESGHAQPLSPCVSYPPPRISE
ncbi:MAG: phospholipase, partial [Candidatus Eisenbacteria bacterium]|nr:phospholipase [Candidatus Eisenbacteria bacterium]